MSEPACVLCGADSSTECIVYDKTAGGVRCVAVSVCRLRAELRDTKGTAARSLTNAASVLDAKDAELRDVTAERDALRAEMLRIADRLGMGWGADARNGASDLRKAAAR